VIDLDTCNASTVLSDLRYGKELYNSGNEDEMDLRKVFFSPEIFKEMAVGFIEGVSEFLNR